MQYNRPLRRTNLQLLHMTFTEARTFIFVLITIHNPASGTIRGKFHRDTITYHDLDIMKAHFASEIHEYLSAVFQFNFKLGVGKRLYNLGI